MDRDSDIPEGAVAFEAEVERVATLAKGGLRISIDLPESEAAKHGGDALRLKSYGTVYCVLIPAAAKFDDDEYPPEDAFEASLDH